MEENNDIDRIFREQMERFEMEPSKKVWDSIEAELDKKKKFRGFWFFWIFLAAGLITFGTYEYLNQAPSGETTLSPELQKEKSGTNAAETHPAQQSKGDVVPAGEENRKENLSEVSDHEITPGSDVAASSSQNELHHSNRDIQSANQETTGKVAEPAKKEIQNHHASSSGIGTERRAGTFESGSSTTSANADQENSVSSPRSSGQEQANPEETNPADVNSANRQTIDGIPTVTENQLAPAAETPASAPAEEIAGNMDARAGQPAEKNEAAAAVENTSDSAAVSQAEKNSAEAAPEKTSGLKSLLRKIGSHTTLSLFYSPDYAVNRTTGTSDATQKETSYSWSSGLKLGYSLSSRWSISAGVNYSSYSKSETFSSVYVTSDSAFKEMHEDDHDHDWDHGHGGGGGGGWGGGHGGGGGGGGGGQGGGGGNGGGPGHDGCHYVVHTSCGDIDLGDVPPQATGDEESGDTLGIQTEVASTVEFINVPLTIRYNLRSKRLMYFVEAGASISFIRNSTANIKIGSYSEDNAVSGLTNFNYSALVNIGAEFNLYKHLSLFVMPNFRYSLTPINDSGSEKSYPFFIGGNIGATIHF